MHAYLRRAIGDVVLEIGLGYAHQLPIPERRQRAISDAPVDGARRAAEQIGHLRDVEQPGHGSADDDLDAQAAPFVPHLNGAMPLRGQIALELLAGDRGVAELPARIALV